MSEDLVEFYIVDKWNEFRTTFTFQSFNGEWFCLFKFKYLITPRVGLGSHIIYNLWRWFHYYYVGKEPYKNRGRGKIIEVYKMD